MVDTILIGTGASGLFLAANLPGCSVLALEKTDRPGRKLLISGGGKCNLTNRDDVRTFLSHFRDRRMAQFLAPALQHFPTEATIRWFSDHGLPLTARCDGKVFPRCMDASAVVRTLYETAVRDGVSFEFGQQVQTIENHDHGFSVHTNERTYEAKTVVLATGGMSYPATGSTGDGYAIAKAFGHTVVPPTPALVGITVAGYRYAKLAGNAIRDSRIDFFRPGEQRRYMQACGDLLFTHDGLSGPAILDHAREIRRGDLLKASLTGTENKDLSRKALFALFSENPRKQVYTLLKAKGLVAPLAQQLLGAVGIGMEETCANLHKEKRKELVTLLFDHPFTVSAKKGFSSAMVTAGGLSTEEFDRKTMQSKIVPGLYAVGELLDVDGKSGGYNIQAAFSMAMLAARSISNVAR
jgi:predicted Rossmann fold flavoprotein